MYVKSRFCGSMSVKEGITHEYQYDFWSLPTFSSIKEEEELVELFTKSQDEPTIYHGDKVEKMIDIGEFSTECFDLKDFATEIITNYAHNVGGEVRYIKSTKIRGGLAEKAYIVVPNDAPYLKKLQTKFELFLHQRGKILERYDLRHNENKSLPDKREEAKYLENREIYINNDFIISLAVAAVSFVIASIIG